MLTDNLELILELILDLILDVILYLIFMLNAIFYLRLKCRVNFKIYDSLDEIQVNLPSRSILINPSDELFKKLEEMNIAYSLN